MLCSECRASLVAGRDQWLGGILVSSAFVHEGSARLALHRLKYEGVLALLPWFVDATCALVPADTPSLVPVRRALLRRWHHGIDPSWELARGIGRRLGIPVVDALKPAPWWPARAGSGRGTPRFTVHGRVPKGAVLVDDVVTTGRTLQAAGQLVAARRAVTITAASKGGRDLG
jgi:predicted amidophosphoribosyltransferase